MTDKQTINLEDLKKVIGGGNNRSAGLNCPRCGCFIATTIEQIIASKSLVCPSCGLFLTIDKK